MKHLSDAPLMGRLMALTTNIRLGISSLVYNLQTSPGAYPAEGRLMALTSNIRLGKDNLQGTISLAYWAHS